MARFRIMTRREEGFSLTEVTVVLIGALIIIAAAVPSLLQTLNQYRVVLAAQGITSQIQFARMKAVASNEEFRVDFPNGQNVYRVIDAAGNVISGPFTLPQGVSWNNVTFPGRFVRFLPTGNCAASGNGSPGMASIVNTRGTRIDVSVAIGGVIRQSVPY